MTKKFHSNLTVTKNHGLNTWTVSSGGKAIFTGTEADIKAKFPDPAAAAAAKAQAEREAKTAAEQTAKEQAERDAAAQAQREQNPPPIL